MFPRGGTPIEKQLSMDFNTRHYMQSGDFEFLITMTLRLNP